MATITEICTCDRYGEQAENMSHIANVTVTIRQDNMQPAMANRHLCTTCMSEMGFNLNRYSERANENVLRDTLIQLLEEVGVKFNE